jgi:copper chaperone for superoxide dismutase
VTDKVRGLARMVQVSPNMTLVDLTIRGLSPGTYWATVRETGDISKGALSTGGIWIDPTEGALRPRGLFGAITVGKNGTGSVFIDRPFSIWEMIGRGMVVSKQHEGEGKFEKNDADTLVGVIARSAGVWDNDKTVCSCSGKTLWEERNDEVKKGML